MRSKKIFGLSISLVLINLASILERADENLLPAVYKEVSAAFDAGPTDLGLHLVSNGILPPHSIWKDSWIAARSVMKVRTFQIIVLQGIVGSLPWAAVVFFTMWFRQQQLSGAE
uniref:Uncharacterized protein n=1 Tax=Zea mays TaxID=4577 RepID=A0A804M640_MAIZE